MAELFSTEVTALSATPPTIFHASRMFGRQRPFTMSYTQSGAGSIADTVVLAKLPPGYVRIYLPLWYLKFSAAGGTATMSIGWKAYTDVDGNAVAASAAGILAATSVVAAGEFTGLELSSVVTAGHMEFQSRDGVEIYATNAASALPDAWTFNGFGHLAFD